MDAVTHLAPTVGVLAACDVLGVARASFYRQRPVFGPPASPAPEIALPPDRAAPARSLSAAERADVLTVLHAERFQDRSPAAVQATLLDEGQYLCSILTMYRILEKEGESRERRDQLVHPAYQRPELLATAPNQLWSWDITKLLGPAKWTYFWDPWVRTKTNQRVELSKGNLPAHCLTGQTGDVGSSGLHIYGVANTAPEEPVEDNRTLRHQSIER